MPAYPQILVNTTTAGCQQAPAVAAADGRLLTRTEAANVPALARITA